MSKNTCSKCGTEINTDAKFCPKCGTQQTASHCSKCGAHIGKNEKFCPQCGLKVRRPPTQSDNALGWGIFAIIAFWIPVIGQIAVIASIIYGFIALHRIKHGNTIESKGKAIAGIVLGFMAVVVIISISISFFISGLQPITGASDTNENGLMTLSTRSEDVILRIADEKTGMPVDGLSVGYATYPIKGTGAMLIIDPANRYSPQIVLLNDITNTITGDAVIDSAGKMIKTVFIDNDGETLLESVGLKKIGGAIGTVKDVMNAIALAAKVLDASGLPVGDYAGKLSIATQRKITQEDAYVENSIANKILKKMVFLSGGTLLSKDGTVPGVSPASVSIDVATTIVDQFAISACGAPNERVLVTEIAGISILGCEHMYISDYIAMPMTVNANGVDQYNLPLSKGSLQYVSKDKIGLAFDYPLDSEGNADVVIPEGDYTAKIESPGFAPVVRDVKANSTRQAPLKAILKPVKPSSPNGKISFNTENILPIPVGKSYSVSLCEPDLSGTSELCGGFDKTTNPTGGMPPYHFKFDTLGGFPPMGISLNLNGMLTGTPSKEGTYIFKVCAVDMAGAQSCPTFTLKVNPEPEEQPQQQQRPQQPGRECVPDRYENGFLIPGYCAGPAG